MSDERFDLSYLGLIAPGADPEQVRQRLRAVFKLTDKGTERLFTGRPVIVKRGVDFATAARFETIFAHAGATLTVTPVDDPGGPDSDDAMAATDSTHPPARARGIDTGHLALAPQGGNLEEPPVGGGPDLDTSYLSLVPGDDWTLADCAPPPTPTPEPDISYLSLAPVEPRVEGTTNPQLDQ
ncbi:hypothetical protein [uncultured Lamprocystis sp.]|jgi:hypothetical protein|uniref:hypothetical protein n=1 Tax=uncultured Lamprocystis sp. TaxID=543132 RepID=UPI0025FA8BD7|nr:hypothetical protein [uncultured Lamprocystis sp.]